MYGKANEGLQNLLVLVSTALAAQLRKLTSSMAMSLSGRPNSNDLLGNASNCIYNDKWKIVEMKIK